MHRVAFLLGLAVLSRAQFLTTDDGSKLFFTTMDRIAGTSQSFGSKLFSWDAVNGIRLVYDANLALYSITGDGSIATGAVNCVDCAPTDRPGFLLHTDTLEVESLPRPARISRNGRFLFDGATLTDRSTGRTRSVGGGADQFVVGNDGSVVYKTRFAIQRADADGTDGLVKSSPSAERIDDADENAIKVVLQPPSSPELLDVLSGKTEMIPSDLAGFARYPARISADGRWVASVAAIAPDYREETQICRIDGTGCKLLTTPPITSQPIAISRSGEVVYARYNGEILRIEAATGRTERIFILPEAYPEQSAPLVPGSAVRIVSMNLGTSVTVNGRPARILARSERDLIVQVPWEATGTVQFTVYGGESPFETAPFPLALADYNPQAVSPRDVGPLNNSAYRQDWSATTYESPARPGEILHVIMVGLGPTGCSVRTNEAAPVDRLCAIARQVDWRWYPSGQPADVLFAGLAPGTVGIYQVDVRVPADAGTGFMALSDDAGHTQITWVKVDAGTR